MCLHFARAFAIVLNMNTLHPYLKRLSKEARQDLANDLGTSVEYLWQIARGTRRASESFAVDITRKSKGEVLFTDLRSDIDWGYVLRVLQAIAEGEDEDLINRVAASDDTQALGGSADNEPKRKGGSGRKTKEQRVPAKL